MSGPEHMGRQGFLVHMPAMGGRLPRAAQNNAKLCMLWLNVKDGKKGVAHLPVPRPLSSAVVYGPRLVGIYHDPGIQKNDPPYIHCNNTVPLKTKLQLLSALNVNKGLPRYGLLFNSALRNVDS